MTSSKLPSSRQTPGPLCLYLSEWAPSGHRPGGCQARYAHISQIKLHLTQPWSLWTPPQHGPATRMARTKRLKKSLIKPNRPFLRTAWLRYELYYEHIHEDLENKDSDGRDPSQGVAPHAHRGKVGARELIWCYDSTENLSNDKTSNAMKTSQRAVNMNALESMIVEQTLPGLLYALLDHRYSTHISSRSCGELSWPKFFSRPLVSPSMYCT